MPGNLKFFIFYNALWHSCKVILHQFALWRSLQKCTSFSKSTKTNKMSISNQHDSNINTCRPMQIVNDWINVIQNSKIMVYNKKRLGLWFMVFNATFNNISVISWQSVLLVEETGENHRPAASHCQTF
jgi:hypothetical protein